MPTLKRRYPGLKFSLSTIKKVVAKLDALFKEDLGAPYNTAMDEPSFRLTIALENGDEWELDSRGEFYDFYRREDVTGATLVSTLHPTFEMTFLVYLGTEAKLTHPDRSVLYEMFDLFEAGAAEASSSYPVTEDIASTRTAIFLGHGNSGTWRELKEFLELQHYDVVTYETEKRLGDSVKETLERMLYRCNFAVLLHTAEDEQRDGAMRARQNVVHETGLFQGRLGFARAIIVREEQCDSFSNVEGINEIRFKSVREAFGEVLLGIRRELEDDVAGPGC